MLKVVFALPCRFWGGPERQTLQAARTLRDRGVADCAFAVLVERGANADENPLIARARAESMRAIPFTLRRRYDVREGVLRMRAMVRAERPDVLVVAGYKANVLAALARAAPTIARVTGWTGEDLKVRAFEWLDRRTLRRHDAVVVVSEAQRALVERCKVPSARIVTVRNAIDLGHLPAPTSRRSLRDELGLAPDAVLVGAVGRLSPEKGQRVLLDAMHASRHTAAHLVLVGDGPDERALRARAAELGLAARTRFLGLRPDGAQIIGALDLLVLPSFTEGLPNVILEAFAYRTPVVASAVGGVPELLGDGRGLTVEPGRPLDLARAVDDALDDREASRARADHAYAHVAASFSADTQTESWCRAFDVALQRRRS